MLLTAWYSYGNIIRIREDRFFPVIIRTGLTSNQKPKAGKVVPRGSQSSG
jgi:hypothetical protein